MKADHEQAIRVAIEKAEYDFNRHNHLSTHSSSLLESTINSLNEELQKVKDTNVELRIKIEGMRHEKGQISFNLENQ